MDTKSTAAASVEQVIFRVAGLFIIASLALAQLHSVYWLWFTAFIGVNMFQASFTGFCPMATFLKKLGLKSGRAF